MKHGGKYAWQLGSSQGARLRSGAAYFGRLRDVAMLTKHFVLLPLFITSSFVSSARCHATARGSSSTRLGGRCTSGAPLQVKSLDDATNRRDTRVDSQVSFTSASLQQVSMTICMTQL